MPPHSFLSPMATVLFCHSAIVGECGPTWLKHMNTPPRRLPTKKTTAKLSTFPAAISCNSEPIVTCTFGVHVAFVGEPVHTRTYSVIGRVPEILPRPRRLQKVVRFLGETF